MFINWHWLIKNSNLSPENCKQYTSYLSSYFFLYASWSILHNPAFNYKCFSSKIKEHKMENSRVRVLVNIYLWGFKNFRNTFFLRSVLFRFISPLLPWYYTNREGTFKSIKLNVMEIERLMLKLNN